jgi:hypothetical protein
MGTTIPATTRILDVSGLPEETVRAMELIVSQLREHPKPAASAVNPLAEYETWSREFHTWLASHKPLPSEADWSRESIYDDQGE